MLDPSVRALMVGLLVISAALLAFVVATFAGRVRLGDVAACAGAAPFAVLLLIAMEGRASLYVALALAAPYAAFAAATYLRRTWQEVAP